MKTGRPASPAQAEYPSGKRAGEKPVRVLLAAGSAPTLAGVRSSLAGHGFEIVAEAGAAAAAIELAMSVQPDLCVIETPLEGGGVKAAHAIRQQVPGAKVVILAATDRSDDLFDALQAGVDGYLMSDTDPARLPHALHGVLAGEAALPRRLVSRLIHEFRSQGRRRRVVLDAAPSAELTSREWQVIQLVRDGLSTQQTAERLFLSPVTVRRHVSTIVQKLGVADRDAAIRVLERAES
jgi:DNA-binding NarL/FixJ family response regulator